MIQTRVITKKQKKFLDETLVALGINLDELLLINNLTELIEENKRLTKENEILNAKLDNLNERLQNSEANIEALNIKLQKGAFEAIWGDLSNEQEQTEDY